MRVLFLDIDGVLNSVDHVEAGGKFGRPPKRGERPTREMLGWSAEMVARLKRIIARTESQIVISSGWRGGWPRQEVPGIWREMFACYGWSAPVIGETPQLKTGHLASGLVLVPERGEEVAAWLRAYAAIEAFVCLDDRDDFLPGQPLVQTSMQRGLEDSHVERCIEILNG